MAHFSHASRLVACLSLLALPVHAALDITEAFNVKSGTDDAKKGGCDDWPASTWFEDSTELLIAGLDAVNLAAAGGDDDDTVEAQKYLETFFNIAPGESVAAVSAALEKVQEFVDGDLAEFQESTPSFYCNSWWLEAKEWGDNAQDGDGDTLEETIGQYLNRNTRELQKGLVPFWTDDFKMYTWDDKKTNYCDRSSALAGTVKGEFPVSTLTFCPKRFGKKKGSGATYSTLAEIPAASAGTSIASLQAHSLNLFHEMFHLVLGHDETPDWSYKLKTIVGAVKNSKVPDVDRRGFLTTAEAVQNPETYAFFALAYWLSKSENNSGFSFATSVAVAKDEEEE